MRLFRRMRADELPARAEAFWLRWSELLPQVSAALGDGEPHRVEHMLCEAVALLHPGLQFSLDRGRRAIYALVVSGQGDPELRPYTDAWKSAAPAEDAIWEYHDAVPPVPDPGLVTLNLGGQRIALAEVVVAVTVRNAAVDVAVFHPAMAGLGAEDRDRVGFCALDATLGERLAADRLGSVRMTEAEPDGAMLLLDLREVVRGVDESARNVGGTG